MSSAKISYGSMALLYALTSSLAWGQSPLQATQDEPAVHPSARTVSLMPQAYQPNDNSLAYTMVEGRLITEDETAVDAYYLDVYQIQPDGSRSLFRTGRQVGDFYQVYLRRGYDYELVLQVFGYDERMLRLNATALEKKGHASLKTAVGFKRRQSASAPTLPATVQETTAVSRIPEVQVSGQAVAAGPELKPTPRLGRVKSASLLRYSLTDERVIQKVPSGAALRVLEYTTKDWWMVSYRGEIGWIPAVRLE